MTKAEIQGRAAFSAVLGDLLADQAHAARVRGLADYALELETAAEAWRRRLEQLAGELGQADADRRLSLARAM
jgi:TorA maturation chaperone TorD